jgi:hypothetical protein
VVISGVFGAYIGPSVGNLYAGDWKRGLIGIGVRLAGTAMAVASVEGEGIDPDRQWLFWGGAVVFASAVVWNLVTVSASVNRYNDRRALKLEIAPMVAPNGRGLTARLVFY